MARIFTSNQVNHVYVAKEISTSNGVWTATGEDPVTGAYDVAVLNAGAGTSYADIATAEAAGWSWAALGTVLPTDNIGAIQVGKDVNNNKYLSVRTPGGVVRSDLLTNIEDLRVKIAEERGFRKATVTFNGTQVIPGEDYILRIEFQNPIGMSPDNKYWKHAAVHATSTLVTAITTAGTLKPFYDAMKESLENNMSREAIQMIKFSSDASGLYIWESEDAYDQNWRLGVTQNKDLMFTVNADIAKYDNSGTTVENEFWGTTVYSNTKDDLTPITRPNSRIAAEFEYFAMGERADIYRGIGWPDNRTTEYVVNSNNQYGYDMINIHYSYVGSNHAIQKSEKDVTILCERTNSDTPGSLGAVATALNTILTA